MTQQGGSKPATEMDQFFEKVAETYEDSFPFMKDVARNVIQRTPPLTSESVILDNACGPGIITGEIIKHTQPNTTPEFFAADYSSAMIEQLRKHDWASKVNAEVLDAQDLKLPDDKFTHSFTNFAVMAFPDPLKAAKHIYRTLKPGGTAALTTWKKTGYMIVFHDAQRKGKPDSRFLQTPFGIPEECQSDWKLRRTLVELEVQAKDMEITTRSVYVPMTHWIS